jgi:hypothetical protein
MLIAKESRPDEETGPGLSCAKMQFAKVFEKREQGRQPPEYSNTHKVMNGTTEGMPDLESGVTKVVNQQDKKLVHDSAWLESEVSCRPKRKKKSHPTQEITCHLQTTVHK